MEKSRIVLCGVGGQGILFATKILSQAAMAQNLSVIGSETHGMAQRGGSVVSHLKIGAAESPLVRIGTCDILFVFEEKESGRYIDFPKKEGLCFINSGFKNSLRPEILDAFGIRGVEVHFIPADKMALAMGAPLTANLIVLGFASTLMPPLFGYESLENIIRILSPEKFLSANLEAVKQGREFALP